MDYCTEARSSPAAVSSPTRSSTGTVINGSQQQYLVRNSSIGGWSNGVWNQVFAGVAGRAGRRRFPTSRRRPYTTLATNPAEPREALPVHRRDRRLPRLRPVAPARLRRARPGRTVRRPAGRSRVELLHRQAIGRRQTINSALLEGKNLLFTPGVYDVDQTIKIKRADTVVLGLGIATLDRRRTAPSR